MHYRHTKQALSKSRKCGKFQLAKVIIVNKKVETLEFYISPNAVLY